MFTALKNYRVGAADHYQSKADEGKCSSGISNEFDGRSHKHNMMLVSVLLISESDFNVISFPP